MAPRATWKGFLNLSLVSVPVKAYSATNSGGTIRLNQLHSTCHSRINLKTVCPACGDVARNDIVKGYEFAKDQYVVIDLDELEKLRTKDATRAIRIEKFTAPEMLDPIYLSESSYFLVPDGVPGQKPFALLRDAMAQKELVCVAQVVLNNKEQLVLVRPLDQLLCMTIIRYSSQLKSTALFGDEIAEPEVSPEELALAETLIDKSTVAEFDLTSYQDVYNERLTSLIEAKVEGKELVQPPDVEIQPVINLMDALKASVASVQDAAGAKSKSQPAAQKSTKKPAKSAAQKILSRSTCRAIEETPSQEEIGLGHCVAGRCWAVGLVVYESG